MPLIINPSPNYQILQEFPELRLELNSYVSRVNHAIDRSFSLANVEPEHSELKMRSIEEANGENDDIIDTLFHDLGVDVFPDDLQGNLPINGIKNSDRLAIKEVFEKILNNQSNLVIHRDSSPAFHQAVLLDILILMSRPTGREILFKIDSLKNKITVKEADAYGEFNRKKRTVSITPEDMFGTMAQSSRGERFIAPLPRFIVFAHELIHFFHNSDFGEKKALQIIATPPTMGKEFTSLEEQYTITGHGNAGLPYSPINENALRADYGIPFRVRHLSKAYPSDFFFEEEKSNFSRVIKDGAILNLFNYLKNENLTELFNEKPFIIQNALASTLMNTKEKEKIIAILIQKGAPIFDRYKGLTMLHCAAMYHCSGKICQMLLDAGIPHDIKDDYGETPLKTAMVFKNKEAVDVLKKYEKPECSIS